MSGWGSDAWGGDWGSPTGPATTTVTDTIYAPDGSTPTGTMVISTNTSWTSADGFPILRGFALWVPVVNGKFSVNLVPNADSNPVSKYKVTMQVTDNYFTQTWRVPSSDTPVGLAAVRSLG